MPNDSFHITIQGLTSDEIADYAVRAIYCSWCDVDPGFNCNLRQPERVACKARFNDGLRALRGAGETAIARELDPTIESAETGDIVLLRDSLIARGISANGFGHTLAHDSTVCGCEKCRKFRLANTDSAEPWVSDSDDSWKE